MQNNMQRQRGINRLSGTKAGGRCLGNQGKVIGDSFPTDGNRTIKGGGWLLPRSPITYS